MATRPGETLNGEMLFALQKGLPLDPRPLARIGEELGMRKRRSWRRSRPFSKKEWPGDSERSLTPALSATRARFARWMSPARR